MLLVKTSFKVSLFGGGRDLPSFFKEKGGQVIRFAIQKYACVTIRQLPYFYDNRISL